jgi:hypothetical protein
MMPLEHRSRWIPFDIYIVRPTTPKYTRSIKMVLLKYVRA